MTRRDLVSQDRPQHDANEGIDRTGQPAPQAKPRPGADDRNPDRTPKTDQVIGGTMENLNEGPRSDRATMDRIVRGGGAEGGTAAAGGRDASGDVGKPSDRSNGGDTAPESERGRGSAG
ncbi:MAG TPA: hypothetical protein VM491_23030 [Burkholderiaceae bacterium]|nr:hypothetical protein [Burkholderiaceae bacterium]